MVNKMTIGQVLVLVLQFTILIAIQLVLLSKSAELKICLTCNQQTTYSDLSQTTDSVPTEFLVYSLSATTS
jgi:hypothetical protein